MSLMKPVVRPWHVTDREKKLPELSKAKSKQVIEYIKVHMGTRS